MFAHKLKGFGFLLLISAISALGGLLFGYVTGIISGAVSLITVEFALDNLSVSILVSSILIAAGFGALGCSTLVDRFGRKYTIILCALLYILGSYLSYIALTYESLVISRLIIGVALGICSFTVPMYISEIAPQQQRGLLVMLNSMALTGGIVIAYGMNIILIEHGGWRAMFGSAIYPAIVLALGMVWLPESPRWLILKQKTVKAKAILARVRESINIDQIDQEIASIQQSLQVMQQAAWRDLFQPHILKILLIGMALAVMQQVTGINCILYYTPTLFEAAGFQGYALQIIPLLMGGINFFMTGVALLCVDRFGRRALLKRGLQIMTLSLGLMVVLLGIPQDSNVLALTKLFACMLFVGSYAMSIGCLFWLLIAELFPMHVKARAMGLMTAINWFANFLVVLAFLPMLTAFGVQLTFAFYGVACMISLIVVQKYIPETKSVTLEHIQTNLKAGKRLREIGA